MISAAEQHADSGLAFVSVGAVALEVFDLATSLASAAALGAKKSRGGANKAGQGNRTTMRCTRLAQDDQVKHGAYGECPKLCKQGNARQ